LNKRQRKKVDKKTRAFEFPNLPRYGSRVWDPKHRQSLWALWTTTNDGLTFLPVHKIETDEEFEMLLRRFRHYRKRSRYECLVELSLMYSLEERHFQKLCLSPKETTYVVYMFGCSTEFIHKNRWNIDPTAILANGVVQKVLEEDVEFFVEHRERIQKLFGGDDEIYDETIRKLYNLTDLGLFS
jgi:hypothetical protein